MPCPGLTCGVTEARGRAGEGGERAAGEAARGARDQRPARVGAGGGVVAAAQAELRLGRHARALGP
eukprot:1119891-Rhodomonas_salina.1